MLVFKKLLLPGGCVLLLNFAFALSMPADTKAAARDKSSMDAFFGVARPEAIGGKLWLVIVLGIIPIILLACIIAVIAFVVCRKKKSKDDQDEVDGDEDGDEEEDKEEEEAKDKEEEMLPENPTQEPSSDYPYPMIGPMLSVREDKEEEMLPENPTHEPSSDYEKVEPPATSLID